MNITAASCIFPSGPGMALAAIALTANMPLNRNHPFYVDRCGDLVRACYFPEPRSFEAERWVALVMAALHDLHAQQPVDEPQGSNRQPAQLAHYHLWLVVPPAARAGVPGDLAAQLSAACAAAPFSFAQYHVVEGGHAAAIHALSSANQWLRGAPTLQTQTAVVVAVDSWLHPDALAWLEGEELLHAAGKPYLGQTRRNPYGFVPSEGAAAVMLSNAGQPWCTIVGAGAADEPILRTNPLPCTGLGWTKAAQAALHSLPANQHITHIMSDLNGEPYRADQFGFTALRIAERLAGNWQRHTPALVTGDVGTATALLHVALSAHMLRNQEQANPGQRHLLLSGSEDGLRSALVLS